MRSTSVVHFTAPLLLALGCVEPLEAPSAYASESFLCGAERAAEWNAFVADCNERHRIDGSCPGVVSFRGDLEGEPFVASSRVFVASISYNLADPTVVREISCDGYSPYFKFRISSEAFRDPPSGPPGVCSSTSVNLFGLEVRGSSAIERMTFQTCEFASTAGGIRFSFSGRFARSGFLDACAHFPPGAPPP